MQIYRWSIKRKCELWACLQLVYLDKRTVVDSQKGKHPLNLRVTYPRRHNRSYGTGLYFTPAEFEKLKQNHTKAPYKDTWNLIDVKIKRAEQVIKSLMPFFSFPAFKERYIQDKSFKIIQNTTSINYICAEVCKDYLENRQFPMTVKINDSVRSILKFTKTENLPMQSITPKFCREYEEYMYNKSKKKSRNGAGINLRHIRILFNKAIDKGLVPKEWYPFKRNNGGKSEFENAYVIPNERRVKDYLNEDELIAFSEAKIFATAAQRRSHWGWLASFYCNGSNAADFLLFKFKDIKNDFIIFYREKTKNSTRTDRKPIKIYLSDELKSLIAEVDNAPAPNNYIFKCFNDSMNEREMYEARIKFTANVSKSVKFLASHLGIHKSMKLSNARHSLANVFKKNNVDRETAKGIFGHSSIITLDHYFESSEDDLYEEVANNYISINSIKTKRSSK